MKNIFLEGSINLTYKRGKSLRELISPSMFPQAQVENAGRILNHFCNLSRGVFRTQSNI